MKYTYIAFLIIIILLIIVIYIIYNNNLLHYIENSKNTKIFKKEISFEKSEFIKKYIQVLNYTTQNLEKEFPTIKDTLLQIKNKLIKSSEILNNNPDNLSDAFLPLYSALYDLQSCYIYIISLRNLKYEKKYICSFINDIYDLIIQIDFKDFNEKIENSIYLLKEFVIYNFYFTKLRTVVKERDVKLFLQFVNNLFLFYINKTPNDDIKKLVHLEIKKTKNILKQIETMNNRLNYINNF